MLLLRDLLEIQFAFDGGEPLRRSLDLGPGEPLARAGEPVDRGEPDDDEDGDGGVSVSVGVGGGVERVRDHEDERTDGGGDHLVERTRVGHVD